MSDIYILLFILFLQLLTMGYTLWRLKIREFTVAPPPFDSPVTNWDYPERKENFVTFPCGNCTEQIVVEDFLMPGDIHVIDCHNCQTSWSIYNPSLIIKQTKELPDSLKTAVAQNMAELHA